MKESVNHIVEGVGEGIFETIRDPKKRRRVLKSAAIGAGNIATKAAVGGYVNENLTDFEQFRDLGLYLITAITLVNILFRAEALKNGINSNVWGTYAFNSLNSISERYPGATAYTIESLFAAISLGANYLGVGALSDSPLPFETPDPVTVTNAAVMASTVYDASWNFFLATRGGPR